MPMNSKNCNSFPDTLHHFDRLPDSAHVRQRVVELLLACSGATVRRRARDGALPRPWKIGRIVAWNVGELRRALQKK